MRSLRTGIRNKPFLHLAWCVVFLSLGLVIGTMACAPFDHMSRSEVSIRSDMLRLTPLGSSVAQVRSIYEERLAPDCRWQQLTDRSYLPHHPLHDSLGARSGLQGCVGSYWNPASGVFTTYVFVRWLFNEEGKLVEIEVEKDVDYI